MVRSFGRAERSCEYLDYYRIQHDAVRGAAQLAGGRPVFVTRGEYYYLSSPLMGWVEQEVPEVGFVLTPPFDSGRLADYPPEFFVLQSESNDHHGRNVVIDLINQAVLHDDYQARRAGQWKRGRYVADLIHIRRIREQLGRPDETRPDESIVGPAADTIQRTKSIGDTPFSRAASAPGVQDPRFTGLWNDGLWNDYVEQDAVMGFRVFVRKPGSSGN
ncbi:MAG: hypothetical protein HQ581_10220 [Planctomycetes bacterium]|nr:hypothetical protein [Planctomycetota bacterium]